MVLGWAVLADTIPLYPLYALLFADAGMSDGQISTLLVLWSTVGIVAEVPTGALADRFSRRGALVASGVLQAAGYVVWITIPGFPAFAAGFLLWGLGGTFGSGALEALVYDTLTAAGAGEHYPRVYGRLTGVGLLSQLPAAAAATVLFSSGGYAAVGWVSVVCCLSAAAVAARLPEVRWVDPDPVDRAEGGTVVAAGYLSLLRSGLAEVVGRPAVRSAALAVAVLGGIDGLEEYFPLLAREWGVPTPWVPVATLAIPLVGAAGAAMGAAGSRLGPRRLATLLAVAALVAGGAGGLRRPVGLAGVALAYGLYRLVLVVTDARLQERIEGPARATATSAASLGTDLTAIALYAVWALGQPVLLAAVAVAVVAALPWLLHPHPGGSRSVHRS